MDPWAYLLRNEQPRLRRTVADERQSNRTLTLLERSRFRSDQNETVPFPLYTWQLWTRAVSCWGLRNLDTSKKNGSTESTVPQHVCRSNPRHSACHGTVGHYLAHRSDTKACWAAAITQRVLTDRHQLVDRVPGQVAIDNRSHHQLVQRDRTPVVVKESDVGSIAPGG